MNEKITRQIEEIKNQSKGYFGNANWGTIAFLNIKYFGILGGLIAFFFVGKISRKFYNHFFRSPNYQTAAAARTYPFSFI